MRKKLTYVLSYCALIPFLVACGSRSSIDITPSNTKSAVTDNAENASIRFAWWGNQIRSSGTLLELQNYKNTENGVTVISDIAEWSDYWSGLATDAAAHMLPDVIQMDYYYLSQFHDKNLLVDLLPYVQQGLIDTDGQSAEILSDLTMDGKLLAIPGGVCAPALIYNQTLLDSLGIAVNDRMTTEDFIEIARQVYNETGIRTNIAYGVEGFLEYFCRAYDEQLYEQDSIGTSRETLEKYYGLYEQGLKEGWLIDPGAFSDITIGSVEQDPLCQGDNPDMTSWCMFAYSYQLYAIRQAAPMDIKLGIVSWPSDYPEKSAYLRPGPAFSMSADVTDPQRAADFIEYMTDPEKQLSVMHGERGIPCLLLTGKQKIAVPDTSNMMVVRYLKEIVAPVASPINPPTPFWAGQAYTLNGSLIEKISYGECTAAEAAEEFLTGCKELLK